MPSRRSVLAWITASPLASMMGMRAAAAASPALGEIFRGVVQPSPGPGLLPVKSGGFVRPGARIPYLSRWVFSVANANDRFALVLQLPRMLDAPCFLSLSGGVLSSDSWGSGFGGTAAGSVVFYGDRAKADEAAALWKVVRRDRVPVGQGLVGRFRPEVQPFTVGSPMEIELDVENTGADTVGFTVGGRQRGPRDNRFAFVVSQHGVALPVVQAYDFGGVMSYGEMKPGARVQVRADLASWTKITAPGVYQVKCSYEAQVTPGAIHPSWPDHGHEVWDLTITGTVDVTVA